MELRIFTEPQQGASYDDLLAVAQATERLGFDAFFRSDHFVPIWPDGGEPGPTDAWVTLGALSRETARIRLGTLVTSATFRLPGPLAITVAQVDAMSGGRVEFGLGAGWYDREHTAYGIPFPSTGERFNRLTEQLEIITGLWHAPPGSTYSFAGEHYSLTDSPALPKPVQQPHPPVIIGGYGPKRTPALAARFGAEFNIPFADEATTGKQFQRVRAACDEAGRDGIVLSAAQVLCCGRDDAEIARRAQSIGREVDELRATSLAGTPEQVVEKARRYGELGASRLYLQVLDLSDLEHLELVAAEVMPHLR